MQIYIVLFFILEIYMEEDYIFVVVLYDVFCDCIFVIGTAQFDFIGHDNNNVPYLTSDATM